MESNIIKKRKVGRKIKMSESQEEKLSRFVAEAVEARQHPCDKCQHDGSKHAFDVYPVKENSKFPCAFSCTVCFDAETKELEKTGD